MREFKTIYNVKNYLCNVHYGRVDLETGTGWEVAVISFANGKIGVGVDRLGYFTFASRESLKYPHYVAEKLFMPVPDAIEMVKFFNHIFDIKDSGSKNEEAIIVEEPGYSPDAPKEWWDRILNCRSKSKKEEKAP